MLAEEETGRGQDQGDSSHGEASPGQGKVVGLDSQQPQPKCPHTAREQRFHPWKNWETQRETTQFWCQGIPPPPNATPCPLLEARVVGSDKQPQALRGTGKT